MLQDMRDKPFVYIPIEIDTRNTLKERKGIKRYDAYILELLENAIS